MSKSKNIILAVLVTVVLALVVLWSFYKNEKPDLLKPEPAVEEIIVTEPELEAPKNKIIGTSVEGRIIESFTYGTGEEILLFVGGMHGGYEWNSVLLAYEFIDSLENGILQIPANLKVVVIPVLNPDGLYSVINKVGRFTAAEIPQNDAHTTGKGRFNANEVDLNRNFDCKWQKESSWRGKTVSAGTEAFSEPEAAALRDLVAEVKPTAVVFWHSQANTVYASECEDGILPATLTMMSTYAKAANYKSVSTFDAYPITGDAEGWLASLGIPAVTVELETRLSPEWERNRAGIEALFSLYSKSE